MSDDRLFSDRPEDIKWRVAQMHASSRIEGIERDPVYVQFVDDLERQGLSVGEQIERFTAFVRARHAAVDAAE